MKKITTFIIAILGIIGVANAQGDYEAFTFSQSDYLGTARFMGAGGAFGATGGDFSALSTNPASIGLFKRNETSFTFMGLSFSNTDSYYYGNHNSTRNFKYILPEAGIVTVRKIHRDNEWRSWQFGFGYNRIMDFNNTLRFSANTHNTLMNQVINHVNGINYNNLSGDGYLAWNSWLIDTIPGTTNQYYSFFSDEDIYQKAVVTRKGAIDEMVLSVGGNYGDKLFIGATVGFPFLNFTEITTYTEDPVNVDDIAGINDYTLFTEQRNSGTGVNLKLGLIYQPAEFLRLGASFHTPTYYWVVRDNLYREMTTHYSNGKSNTNSYTNNNRFSLVTPLKFNVSAAFLIAKRAFIAAEYEFQNYGMANLNADNYDYVFENELVQAKYGVAHNIRVGAEVNITQGFVMRAGYRLKTSPYKSADNNYNNTTQFISGGIGFRGEYIFCDLSYAYRLNKDSYWLYDPVGEPGYYTTNTHNVILTLGCKF